ncbi:MAG: NusG domain II-containing protein [Clostridia bacterium]|nr:NusG domain II-containing protein [Clostridia bacterium]
MKNKRLRNIILIAVLLTAAAILFPVLHRTASPGTQFEILLRGERLGLYALADDRDIPIEGICIVSVRNGTVFMKESNCPGKTCVHHAPVSNGGETIVCLPNQVVIRVLGSDADVDYVI